MNHDDISSSSMSDLSVQPKKSAAIEPVNSSVDTLAVTADFQVRQTSVESSQPLALSVVDNFLPSPNRLLALGSLGLVAALGAGAVASTFVTHRTTVDAQAVIEPVKDVQLIKTGSEGVVEAIYVQEHETLKPGQEIASFDNPSLQTKVTQIKAQIARTEERIVQIDGQLKALEERRIAEVGWLKQLRAGNLDIGNNQSQFNSSRIRLTNRKNILKKQLEEQRTRLEEAQQKVDNLTVRAPKEGSIYELELERLGQTFSANETIAKIVPNGVALKVKALIPETQIRNVEVGYPAEISLSSCTVLSFGTLQGQVTSIEPADTEISPTQSANRLEKTYQVTVETNAKNLHSDSRTCELLPGMEGELTIIVKQEKLLNFFLRKLDLRTII